MPTISSFFGIIIYMYWRDHNPPHFHAKYGDEEVTVEIETGKISGNIPGRALSIIQEWREFHKEELLNDWKLAEGNKPLMRIKPLV
ncbi:MAG: DUF4160 domain-containing protein [Nitrospirae bacterium]|nr:DUF4160 domain-containing protein [Nitrospirota bacterium]